jgi:nucleosome binding factor SPN SPT16 subunit
LPVLIQSGETFNINKFNVDSDQNKLNYETVYINVCARYKDMNAMASRTLLVNPKDEQKTAYILANETLEVVIRNLKVGEPIKNAYIEGKNFIKEKNP